MKADDYIRETNKYKRKQQEIDRLFYVIIALLALGFGFIAGIVTATYI